MRREGLSREDILEMVSPQNRRREDPKGNPVYVAEVRGKAYCAVVASDDGSLITVYDLRK